jgi:hypothetical protein
MNKQRRNRIEYVKAKLGELKYEIEILQEEEDEEYNNLPENIQDSDQGQSMYEIANNLQDAADFIDEAIDYLDQSIFNIKWKKI